MNSVRNHVNTYVNLLTLELIIFIFIKVIRHVFNIMSRILRYTIYYLIVIILL